SSFSSPARLLRSFQLERAILSHADARKRNGLVIASQPTHRASPSLHACRVPEGAVVSRRNASLNLPRGLHRTRVSGMRPVRAHATERLAGESAWRGPVLAECSGAVRPSPSMG